MTQSWMEISRKAGDPNLGQTLVRLAGLAAAAHRFAAAQAPATGAGASDPLAQFDPQADLAQVRTDADRPAAASPPRSSRRPQRKVHTEVDR